MRKFLFILMMVSASMAHAQSKLTYTAGVEAGILRGSSDKSSTFLFTNGVAYKNIMAGVGAGVDNYLFRSIPVFIQVKKAFGNHRLQPFVNASAGINFSHPTSEQKFYYTSFDSSHFKNGFITNASAGVALKISGAFRVFISAGYSYKTTKVAYKYYYYMVNQAPDTRKDIYHLNRWCFSTGFWF